MNRGLVKHRVSPLVAAAIAMCVIGAILQLSPTRAEAYSGAGGVWAMKSGTFTSKNCPGTDDGIRAALSYLGASGGSIQLTGGTFDVDTTITVSNPGITIYGAGDATVLRNTHSTGVDIFNITAAGVTIRTLKIDGQNGTKTAGRGIEITADDARVENCTVSATPDAAIWSSGQRTVVNGNRIFSPGDAGSVDGYGVLFSSSSDGRVEGNYIGNPKSSGIYLFSASERNRVTVNEINTGPDNGIRFEGKATTVTTNTIYDMDVNGIRANGDSSTVASNTIFRCNLAGIYTNGVDGGTWASNTVMYCTNSGLGVGHETKNTNGLHIVANYSARNTGAGIVVNPSTTRAITNLTIANNQLLANSFEGVRVIGASFASTAYVYGNVSQGNTVSDTENLSATNWTYARANFPVGITSTGVVFANLGTPANGVLVFCTDCTKATPCAGGGTGAFAKRANGAWDCN